MIAIEYRRRDFRFTCRTVGRRISVVLRDVNVTAPGSRTLSLRRVLMSISPRPFVVPGERQFPPDQGGTMMPKITVAEFVSLDGVMEDPGGAEGYEHGGWTFKYPDDEGMKFKFDELMDADAQLLGRVTYEGFAKAWPT